MSVNVNGHSTWPTAPTSKSNKVKSSKDTFFIAILSAPFELGSANLPIKVNLLHYSESIFSFVYKKKD